MVSPLRRLAIATSRTEECIRFYRDVIGLKKFYDDVMTNAPGVKSLLGPEGEFPQRLVSMQMRENTTGMMGFLEYLKATFTVRPFDWKPGAVFPIGVEFLVANLDAVVTKALKNGAAIIGGPVHRQLPGIGTTTSVSFTDPNGVLVQAVICTDQVCTPSPIRRVIIPLVSGKAEATARFYQKVLGMTVESDEVCNSTEDTTLLGLSGRAMVHTITLKQGQEEQGMLSFMEFRDPPLEVRPFVKRQNYPYEVIFVFIVDDIDLVLSKAIEMGGQFIGRRKYEVPGRGMAEGASFTDGNGVLLDLTCWL